MCVGPIVKWVDDFAIFRFPLPSPPFPVNASNSFSYAYGLEEIKAMIGPLGIPWHSSKGQDFGPSFVYMGFYWDIDRCMVSLTDEKRLKFKGRVDSFLLRYATARAPLHEALTLSGSLSHIAFVYPHGRSYLSNLSSWISQFPWEFRLASRYPSRSVLTDLRWWSKILENDSWTRSLRPKGPPVDLGIWVDASTEWGVGLVWKNGESWDAWKLQEDWKGPARNIGWLEGVAVELAIRILDKQGYHNVNVLIRSDNQGIIGAWQRGRG
jgi:hypothetical protein